MKKLSLVILCTALGCRPTHDTGTPSNPETVITNTASIDVTAVNSIWKSDKPEIQRFAYELLQQLIQAEFKGQWVVPTEPIIIDELDLTRNLNDPQYQLLRKHHAKLCRLEDVYYAPGDGVVHKETKEQAWLFCLTIRFCNNERLYIANYNFYHGLEAAHGGIGSIDYDTKQKKFFVKGGFSLES